MCVSKDVSGILMYIKSLPTCDVFADDLIPLILVELVFVLSVPADEARDITNAIDGLIREHLLPEKSNVRYIISYTGIGSMCMLFTSCTVL